MKYFFALLSLNLLLLPAFAQEPTLSTTAPAIDPAAFPSILPAAAGSAPGTPSTQPSTEWVPGTMLPAKPAPRGAVGSAPARFTPENAGPPARKRNFVPIQSSRNTSPSVTGQSGAPDSNQADNSLQHTEPPSDRSGAAPVAQQNSAAPPTAQPYTAPLTEQGVITPAAIQAPALNQAPLATQAPASAASEAPVPGNIQPVPKNSKLEDYTDKLRLVPGISITFPITEGIDTHRQRIGNYDFTARIHDSNGEEFAYDWYMSAPAEAMGFRAVAPEDEKGAYMVSLFYQDKQRCTMSGYTNTVRISDALYKGLKSGKTMSFQIDLDDSRDVPSRIRMIGREYATVYVDGRRVKVRAIKAETDNHWRYWIMDKATFPIIVAGTGPFIWHDPRFDSSNAESRRVVNDLEKKGVATTYAILFAFNSANLQESSKSILNGIAIYLNSNRKVRLAVEGHCDIIGNAAYNLKLSQRRSESVKAYLVSRGIDGSRLQPIGYGFTRPIADNNTAAGRAKNRRVVFRKI